MKSARFLRPQTVRSLGGAASIILISTSLASSAATTDLAAQFNAMTTANNTNLAAGLAGLNTTPTKTTTSATPPKTTTPAPTLPSATKIKPLPGAVSTYALNSDQAGDNVPATFGAVFAKGDIPSAYSLIAKDSAGKSLPIQVDVKARHPDGSLRHAVVTVIAPHLSAGQDYPVGLSRGTAPAASPMALSVLPSNFDTTVTLSMKDGTKLTASAKALLASAKPDVWLSGPQVTEWWVSGPLRNAQGAAAPHLSVRFGIRSYGKDRPVRVEVNVENTWMWVSGPRTEFFDGKITANGKTILDQPGMSQQAHTRWRKTFWWSASSDVFVKQDLDYLKKARVVPNYNPNNSVSEATLADYYKKFLATDRRSLETGIVFHYMPATGGRGDIGPLPQWTVFYLLTMDKRAYEIMLTSGDLAGSYTSHYRNEKTDRPGTTEEFPNISTHSNLVGKPGNLEKPNTGGVTFNIVAEAAHEPSLAFVPYLVTGDRYYLEELQFWSQWNAWGTTPKAHGYGKSLVNWDQIRGQAWSLRTLAHAAFVTPDNDPMKATLGREMTANFAAYNEAYSNNSNANIFHAAADNETALGYIKAWMDDFLTWSVGYAVQLGFDDGAPFAKWKGYAPVQRMTNPDYCYILASTYHMVHTNADHSPLKTWREAYQRTLEASKKGTVDTTNARCGSAEMATALGLPIGKMSAYKDPIGYTANLKPALAAAIDFGVPGAQTAWDKYLAQGNPIDPRWDILPWKK